MCESSLKHHLLISDLFWMRISLHESDPICNFLKVTKNYSQRQNHPLLRKKTLHRSLCVFLLSSCFLWHDKNLWSWTQTYHFFHIHHDMKWQTRGSSSFSRTATWIADWDWEIPQVLEVQGAYHGLFPNQKCMSPIFIEKKTRVFARQLSGSQTVKQKNGVVFDIYFCCLLQLEVMSKKNVD